MSGINKENPELRTFKEILEAIIESDLIDAYEREFAHRRSQNYTDGAVLAKDGGDGWRDANYHHDVVVWAASQGVPVFKGRSYTSEEIGGLLKEALHRRFQKTLQNHTTVPLNIAELASVLLDDVIVTITEGTSDMGPMRLSIDRSHEPDNTHRKYCLRGSIVTLTPTPVGEVR